MAPKGKGKGKRESAAEKTAAKIASLEKRIRKLETRIGVSHEIQDVLHRISARPANLSLPSERLLAKLHFLDDDAEIPVELVDLEFDLDTAKTTAEMTRVYLEGSDDDIASTAQHHGVLPRQVDGSTVTVVMDASGDPAAVGVFKVKNALQTSISVTAAVGVSIKFLVVRKTP
jgi:hypothetical protein